MGTPIDDDRLCSLHFASDQEILPEDDINILYKLQINIQMESNITSLQGRVHDSWRARTGSQNGINIVLSNGKNTKWHERNQK